MLFPLALYHNVEQCKTAMISALMDLRYARTREVRGTHVDAFGHALGFRKYARKGFTADVTSAFLHMQEKKHHERAKHLSPICKKNTIPEVFGSFDRSG